MRWMASITLLCFIIQLTAQISLHSKRQNDADDYVDDILEEFEGNRLEPTKVSKKPAWSRKKTTTTVAPPVTTSTTTEASIANGDADATSDTEIIKKLLGKGYDWRVRPPGINLTIPGTHGAVIVYVNMLIRSISKIDDVNMEYSVQLTFREEWVDGRLAYGFPGDNKPDFLILTAGQQIWMPDSFFQNEKSAHKHDIDKPNVLIRIHKDGRILYSVRISMVLSCPMHLQYYPMDVQTCFIDLASYAYTENDIEYRWKNEGAVQIKDGLKSSLPSFQLNNISTDFCNSKTNTGTYSCLRTIVQLQRQFSYYLLQLYIPSTMLVIVSWVSFWLDRGAVPARVTLGVTTLLTMTTQASGINAKLPPVSYTKAIDVWIGACLTFIFGALLEFAWVTYISSRSFHKNKRIDSGRNSLMIGSKQAMIIPNTALTKFSDPAQAIEMGIPMDDPEVWIRQGSNASVLRSITTTNGNGTNGHGTNGNGTNGNGTHENAHGMINHHNVDEAAELIVFGPRKLRKTTKFYEFVRRFRIVRWAQRRLDIQDGAKKADLVSRVLFPTLFVFFNFIYWTKYSQYTVLEAK